jgi:hypothetical protein
VTAARALLAGIVDYAGLFPPASLDLPTAARNYAAYLACGDAWMLGRFVVPIARLDELAAELPDVVDRHSGGASPWRVSALFSESGDAAAEVGRARAFNAAHHRSVVIDSLEGRIATPNSIAGAARAARGEFTLFVEVPLDATLPSRLAAVREAGACAKVRTGGVTAGAFPPSDTLLRFIAGCVEAKLPFKATAGLHHPLRGSYRLTYDAGAASGSMFGFLSVFLATAFLRAGLPLARAAEVLDEADPAAFTLSDDGMSWRGSTLDAAGLRAMRASAALSFGSCSFREPVDALRRLGMIA